MEATPTTSDTDGDTVPDNEEVSNFQTSPRMADSDLDGFGDYEESQGYIEVTIEVVEEYDTGSGIEYFYNYFTDYVTVDANDWDGDGDLLSDGYEMTLRFILVIFWMGKSTVTAMI